MARPQIENPKTAKVTIRLTDQEREKIAAASDKAGVSFPEHVRRRVADHKFKSKVNYNLIEELRQRGATLKRTWDASHTDSQDVRDALDELVKTLRKIAPDKD